MYVTWTLKDASGAALSHQPAGGSPLALKFDSSGYAHLSGYATEIIAVVECLTDTSSVSVSLTPDTSGDTLSQSLSNPTKNPAGHSGTLTWTNGSSGLTTLDFSVPTAVDSSWAWDCLGEPAIGLKSKYKLKRGGAR